MKFCGIEWRGSAAASRSPFRTWRRAGGGGGLRGVRGGGLGLRRSFDSKSGFRPSFFELTCEDGSLGSCTPALTGGKGGAPRVLRLVSPAPRPPPCPCASGALRGRRRCGRTRLPGWRKSFKQLELARSLKGVHLPPWPTQAAAPAPSGVHVRRAAWKASEPQPPSASPATPAHRCRIPTHAPSRRGRARLHRRAHGNATQCSRMALHRVLSAPLQVLRLLPEAHRAECPGPPPRPPRGGEGSGPGSSRGLPRAMDSATSCPARCYSAQQ